MATTSQVLPNRQRVDFAELADVSEFVLAEDIPNGTYERAIVRLDFSDAEVSVEVDGLPAAAEVVDANGDAVGIVEVDLCSTRRARWWSPPRRPPCSSSTSTSRPRTR